MKERYKAKEPLSKSTLSMRLDNLTDAIIDEIVTIYDQVVESESAREFVAEGDRSRKLTMVRKMFEFSNAVERRFGCRLSSDSKFYIRKEGWDGEYRLIKFSFDPNMGVSDPNP